MKLRSVIASYAAAFRMTEALLQKLYKSLQH
jgi:hypothetical protein